MNWLCRILHSTGSGTASVESNCGRDLWYGHYKEIQHIQPLSHDIALQSVRKREREKLKPHRIINTFLLLVISRRTDKQKRDVLSYTTAQK